MTQAPIYTPSRFERAAAQLLAYMAEPGAEFPDALGRVGVQFPGICADSLRDAYDVATVGSAPLTDAEATHADQLTRTHTAFSSLADMADAGGNYSPSIYCSSRNTGPDRAELLQLANLYDRHQAARGDARRAYRY